MLLHTATYYFLNVQHVNGFSFRFRRNELLKSNEPLNDISRSVVVVAACCKRFIISSVVAR